MQQRRCTSRAVPVPRRLALIATLQRVFPVHGFARTPGFHRYTRAALGILVLALASDLMPASTVSATAFPTVKGASPHMVLQTAFHQQATVSSRKSARRAAPRTNLTRLASPYLIHIRYLPYQESMRANASAVALLIAWQHGQFRHSATRPRPLSAAIMALRPQSVRAPAAPPRPVAVWKALPAAESKSVVTPTAMPTAIVTAVPTPEVTPVATATPAPVYGDTVHDAIYRAAQRWGVSYWYLVRLATCESGLNPGAANPSGATGLFQFMPSTYYAYAARIGEEGSIWNPYSNANVAAYMISQGQAYQWTCASLI